MLASLTDTSVPADCAPHPTWDSRGPESISWALQCCIGATAQFWSLAVVMEVTMLVLELGNSRGISGLDLMCVGPCLMVFGYRHVTKTFHWLFRGKTSWEKGSLSASAQHQQLLGCS